MKIKIFLITFVLILIIFGFFAYFYLSRSTISISSNPSSANVYINGKFVGTTPYETKLFKGKYEIRIVKDGFEEYSATVDIKGNKKEIISPNLEKLEYLLLVRQNKFYKVRTDGKVVKQLGESTDGNPIFISFSPDGSKILYEVSSPSYKNSIWIMDVDGSNRKNLTGNIQVSGRDFPQFFPDGKKVLFIASGSKKGYLAFWTIDINGGDIKKVIEVKSDHEEVRYAISPDGKKILFYGYDILQNLGTTSLWVLDYSGQNLINLTSEMNGKVIFATFFPDGNNILLDFFSSSKPQLTGLWVLSLDGKNIKKITKFRENNDSEILSPKFSKDGKRIFFISGNCLWSVNIDGTDEKIIKAAVFDFCFFTKEEKILLLETQSSLWVINIDGTGEKKITGDLLGESDSTFPTFYYIFGPPFSLSPDESHVLLTKAYTEEVYIASLYTGKITKLNGYSLSCWFPEKSSNN